MQTNNANNNVTDLITEARRQLDALAALAAQIKAAGLVNEAAAALTAETEADYANGVALLGLTAADNPRCKAEYDSMVEQLGYAPQLNVEALIGNDLRDAFVASVQTW